MKSKICIFLLALWLAGCNDFLTESSQDEVKPSTVEDLEQILLGDAYLNDYNIYNITFLFTDDAQCNGLFSNAYEEQFNKDRWKFTWSDKMFTDEGAGYDANFWEVPYKGIWGCNIVLDNLDKVEGNDRLRASIRGEALVLRSWYYFMLVNFFGYPYNYGDPTQNLAVPLKLNANVTTDLFTRNTVAEVYTQIESDLLEGNRLLKESDYDRSYFRIGHLAAKAILSRMYLYMENWDKALAYADSVLTVKPGLLDLNKVDWVMVSVMEGVNSVYSVMTPDEIVWARECAEVEMIRDAYTAPLTISQEFCDLLGFSNVGLMAGTIKDIRASAYIFHSMNFGSLVAGDIEHAFYPFYFMKENNENQFSSYQGIRTAELYLNRAEAYARKYLKEGSGECREKALSDLNELRRHRFNSAYEYVPVNIQNAEDLLAFCQDERRRELCGETNHRWFDLRRYGMPGLTHAFFKVPGESETYTLKPNRYVLPIPEKVIQANPSLRQNL